MTINLKWFYHEFGIASIRDTGRDALLIVSGRTFRMFAYGANSIFLALFFAELGFSDERIGLFMTLTLAGDVFLTLGLTLIADRLGRRRTLLIGSCMMVVSGTVFALFENFWLLLLAAVFGVISPSGGDFGPFRAIEESIISQITIPSTRSDVLSWYVTAASIGAAIGTESAGRMVHVLERCGWSKVDAYHAIFSLYVLMGLVNIVCVLLLSPRTELEPRTVASAEEEILLEGDAEDSAKDPRKPRSLASLQPSTRSVMFKLWPLLAVDCLADGMVGYSLTTYFFDTQFHVSSETIGDITSISYVLAAVSTIFAGPLARHLGLINTMVFTHVPSSAAVLGFPFAPNVVISVILFFIRTGLNNMDQAPRAAFIAAVVPTEERTVVNGITTTLRTLASTAGPTITGLLAGSGRFAVAFVTAGSLRLAYDFGLWFLFVNMKVA